MLNRVTETLGLVRHTDAEIIDYIQLAEASGIQLIFSLGPRATYDIGASARTEQGSFIGNRLRGADQLRRALEEVERGLELGCRAFVVYDEGLLDILGSARTRGMLPEDLFLKASAHLGHANPASARLLERLGANSINPIRDLTVPMIASIRSATHVPLDIHVDNPASSGGFIRTLEAAEIVTVARPVHLKTGNSVVSRHGAVTSSEDGERMAVQAEIVLESLRRYGPELTQSEPKEAAQFK